MKRIRVFLTALIVGGFMFSTPSPAFAEQAFAEVTCAKGDGTEQTFSIGWDNSNQFFDGRGEIPRLYCEGGYAQPYNFYVRDNLPADSPLRWFNGIAPVLEPTPEPVPSIEPSLNPDPTPTPEPSQSESLTPEATESPTAEPTPEATQIVEPTATSEPTTVVEATPIPETTPTPTPTQSQALPIQPPSPEVETTAEPEQSNDSSQLPPEPTLEPTTAEVTQEVIDDALADGVLTDDERELVADALLAEFLGEAITFEALQESRLDYQDLPPETPVTLENGVVLTAEIADAIEIFDSGAEVLATILENPAKAIKALLNVGADMTQEERETAQNTVVAAVVVTQVAQVRKTK
jgi:hypothetical protein